MERQKMSDVDREKYLSMVKMKISDPKVIALIEDDIEHGLSAKEIDDYADRRLKYEQQKVISEMYRKEFPKTVVGAIGRSDMSAEKMRVAMELYEKNVNINEIKKLMAEAATARDMREAFNSALTHVQKQIANEPQSVSEEPITKEQESELLVAVRALADSIQSSSGNYEAIQQMLKQMETIQLDEAVTKNLTSLNEKLEKENRELSEQLAGKQDEIAKGLQTVSKLRSEIDKIREEKNKMEEKVNRLTEENEQIAREQKAKGQETESEENVLQAEKRVDASYKESVQNEERLAEQRMQDKSQILPPVKEGAIPVYYTLTMVNGNKVISNSDIEIMSRKPSVFESIMSKFAFKKKSHKNLIQLVINKELSAEQVNEIRGGMEKGLDEEQLEIIINKNLSPEKIRSIVGFAALQNSLKAERGGC